MQISLISVAGLRDKNQDCLLVNGNIYSQEHKFYASYEDNSKNARFFVVADGMGGESDGEKASYKLVSVLREELSNLAETEKDARYITNQVIDAINKAQKLITDELDASESIGGTTVSALLIFDGKFVTFNIGDSPIYLIRKNKMQLLSETHTLAQKKLDEGVSKGKIDESDFHCLVQCVGSGGFSEIAVTEGYCCKGDAFVVASDGLLLCGERKIKKFVEGKDFKKLIKKFMRVSDNVSGIAIKM